MKIEALLIACMLDSMHAGKTRYRKSTTSYQPSRRAYKLADLNRAGLVHARSLIFYFEVQGDDRRFFSSSSAIKQVSSVQLTFFLYMPGIAVSDTTSDDLGDQQSQFSSNWKPVFVCVMITVGPTNLPHRNHRQSLMLAAF